MTRAHPHHRKLDAREQAFVREYLVDLDPQRAAIDAGYAASMARTKAYRWVSDSQSKPHVYAAGQAAVQERATRTEIRADRVLQRLWDIATADPNELIQHQRVNCRHCYGIGHEYQWIDHAEHQHACDAIDRETKEGEEPRYPSMLGGFGFDQSLTPHAKCPKCGGDGYGRVHALDTRKLSRSAKALFAGVKATKDGLEIKMHDQLAALEKVGKHLGMFSDKVKFGTEEGDPLRDFLMSFMGTRIAPVEKAGREATEDAQPETLREPTSYRRQQPIRARNFPSLSVRPDDRP